VTSDSILRRALVSLLDARDFLGFQLSHANGLMSESQLDEVSSSYLKIEVWEDAALADAVTLLASLIPDRLDADVVSTMFSCSVTQASRILLRVASQEQPTAAGRIPNCS